MTTIKNALVWLPNLIRDLLVRWLAGEITVVIQEQREAWEAHREAFQADLEEWVSGIRHRAQKSLEDLRVGTFDSGYVTPANRTAYVLFETGHMGHIGAWIAATGQINPNDKIIITTYTYTENGLAVPTSITPMGPGAHEIPFDELKGRHAISVPEYWAPYGGKVEVMQDFGQGMNLHWAAYCR